MDDTWRFVDDVPAPEEHVPAPEAGSGELGHAWLRLQVLHTPLRSSVPREQAALTGALRDLERIFLANEGLGEYYRECLRPESETPAAAGPGAPLTPTRHIDYVARLQVLLMQEAYYTLSLVQYANALDNRGWMNLFRRWGRSPTFNRRLDELRATLNLNFLEFYDLYLRYMPMRIDEHPVPHPWDSTERRRDPRAGASRVPARTGGEPDLVTALEPASITEDARDTQPQPQLLPGIFLDPGVREVMRGGPSPGERPVAPAAGSEKSAGGG